MPGYEPFLLCDFHVHTRGATAGCRVREVVDLYGATGKFDVIAITDHILMKKDLLARAGRMATLGPPRFGVREDDFDAYLDGHRGGGVARADAVRHAGGSGRRGDAEPPARQARTRTSSRSTSSTTSAPISRRDAILREIRRQDALSIACHPHHRTHAAASRSAPATCGTTARSCRTWWTCGRPPIATTCSR